MKIAVLFLLSALAGCGQEPVGDIKKVSIIGSRTVSKMVEKGTRVFGKTFGSAKNIFIPKVPQLELAIPEGPQRELPNLIGDEKTWLSKDWIRANTTFGKHFGEVDPDRIRELERRKKLSKKEQRRLAKEDERRRKEYRKKYGEYAGKHGQPQPPW